MPPILFIESLPPRQIANLERLYGPVIVIPEFDAKHIHRTLVDTLS